MTVTATKGELTAERILDAALRSIATRGCGAVTLRGIAEEAGVALSQLNYYYGNKDRLFGAVLTRIKRDYIFELNERLNGSTTLQERIGVLVDYNEFILRENIDIYRAFLEFFNFAMSSAPFRAEVSKFIADISAMIASSVIRDGEMHSEEAPYSAEAITRFIYSASFGISLQHLLSPDNAEIMAGFKIARAMLLKLT